MTQSPLNFENIPLVSIEFMNRTHHEELEMVNILMEKITARLSDKPSAKLSEVQNDIEISQLLEQWLEHTKVHFTRENELMQETAFPAYSVHSEEHEIALKRMQTVIGAWQQNKDIDLVKDYVFTLWPNWFKAHVSTMDKMTAEFALNNGFKEE